MNVGQINHNQPLSSDDDDVDICPDVNVLIVFVLLCICIYYTNHGIMEFPLDYLSCPTVLTLTFL